MSTTINSNPTSGRHPSSPLVFVIPGVVTGAILVICIIVTLCVCARYRGWCPRIFRVRRTRQPQKQEIERIKNKIIEQYRRRKRKSRKNDVIPDVIDSTLICAICLDGYVSTISKRHRMLAQLTQCGHHFHFNCIFQWLDRNPSCPVCRTPVSLSDDKIKAIGLQDVCCLDKPMDLMPPVSHHDVMIMTPTAEPTTTFHPSSGTPSPRLMAAYLLPSNQDSPSVPSVGTASTFSTMSSVKSSNTLDRSQVNPLPSSSTDPQPSTSTSPPPMEMLNVTNLPKLVTAPPTTSSEIIMPSQVTLPRAGSQVVVNVEINALASSFYNDSSSSDSSHSEDSGSRRSTTSSSSYDSANDIWLPDNSSIPRFDSSFDGYGSTTNIVGRVSTDLQGARGLDNPAFEQDFDESPRRDLPKVHRPVSNTDSNDPPNCDMRVQNGSNQFSIINETERHTMLDYSNSRPVSSDSHGASSSAISTGSIRGLRIDDDSITDKALSRNSIAEMQICSQEGQINVVPAENVQNGNSISDSNTRKVLSKSNSDVGRIIPNEQCSDDANTQVAQYSELPGPSATNANCHDHETTQAYGESNVPIGTRRTRSNGAHDYAKRKNTRPHSAEASPNMDSSGRPRVNSYSRTAKANVEYKRNQTGCSSPSRDRDEYTATLNSIDWSNRPGSSRYVPKPRQNIRRTPSASERHATNPARNLPSRTPPSAVSEHPEDPLHSSGSMPDFDRPNRKNGRMWQYLSSSLSALSGSSMADSPLTSTYM